jgi:hypothetical protein
MTDRTKDKDKDSASQLCSFLRDSYLDRTSRPIYALGYLAFFIILYEIGTILISPAHLSEALLKPQIRVVAFVWVQNLLELLGFSERLTWLTTPLFVVVILIAIQITSRTRWRVHIKDFLPMTIECALLAVPLVVLSLLLNRPPAATAAFQASNTGPAGAPPVLLVDTVTGIGAGIYEELVFRLILICLLMLIFQDLFSMPRRRAVIFSVLISAVLFSAHHHIFFVNGRFGAGEVFSVARFTFRLLAGVYFAVLFAVRGFGTTAGTHVFYNIIVAFLNALVFSGGR